MDDGDGPGPVGEDVTGGLLLFVEEQPPWAHVANEVYDLCDDSEAFIAATGRLLGPGDEITLGDRIQIERMRSGDEVVCDEPGGNRYSYMTNYGRLRAQPTVEKAVAAYEARRARGGNRAKTLPPGLLLGYYGQYQRQFPLVEQDEVVVLHDTVSVRDGIVRGLVHNLSETQYAREVTVTARAAQSDDDAGAGGEVVGSWRWPLTVQPGERAPFEIPGWTGASDPEAVSLQVSSSMSQQIDFKRSFGPIIMHIGPSDEAKFRRIVPDYSIGDQQIPQHQFYFYEIWGMLQVPHSPPGAKELMAGIVIEDPRMYFATFDNDHKVVDVIQRPTYIKSDSNHMPIDRLPATFEFIPGQNRTVGEMIANIIVGGYRWQVWMGGANPPPTQQPTGQPAN